MFRSATGKCRVTPTRITRCFPLSGSSEDEHLAAKASGGGGDATGGACPRLADYRILLRRQQMKYKQTNKQTDGCGRIAVLPGMHEQKTTTGFTESEENLKM